MMAVFDDERMPERCEHWKPHDKSMPPCMAMMVTRACVRAEANKAQAPPHRKETLLATDYRIVQRVRMPIKRDARKPPIRVLSRAPIPA
jgi:hypothetical protein